ncbi:MAG: hypothetical protein R2705_06465 [Ilumatobacteraceae bacterium]
MGRRAEPSGPPLEIEYLDGDLVPTDDVDFSAFRLGGARDPERPGRGPWPWVITGLVGVALAGGAYLLGRTDTALTQDAAATTSVPAASTTEPAVSTSRTTAVPRSTTTTVYQAPPALAEFGYVVTLWDWDANDRIDLDLRTGETTTSSDPNLMYTGNRFFVGTDGRTWTVSYDTRGNSWALSSTSADGATETRSVPESWRDDYPGDLVGLDPFDDPVLRGPDGRGYALREDGSASLVSEGMVLAVSGTSLAQIRCDESGDCRAVVSRDGTDLPVELVAPSIYQSAVFSPDGRWLTMDDPMLGGSTIKSLDGSPDVNLPMTNYGSVTSGTWTPDSWWTFVEGSNLVVVNPETGNRLEVRLPPEARLGEVVALVTRRSDG